MFVQIGTKKRRCDDKIKQMKKLKIYLDTSVINFLFADDAPDFKKITEEFFENYVVTERYDIYISEIVIQEIERTKDDKKRNLLLGAVNEHCHRIFELTDEADKLANFNKAQLITMVNGKEGY